MSDQQASSGAAASASREGSPQRPLVGPQESATVPPADGASRPRPSVMSLAIRERAALYAAYMRFVDGGGLFIPTTRPARIGDEIYAILTLLDEPGKVALPGRVCWITPAGVPGRPQGIGLQFARNDAGEAARVRIETLLSSEIATNRPTHTI